MLVNFYKEQRELMCKITENRDLKIENLCVIIIVYKCNRLQRAAKGLFAAEGRKD